MLTLETQTAPSGIAPENEPVIRAALYNLFATALSRGIDESWLNPNFQRQLAAGLPDQEGKPEMLGALAKIAADRGFLREIQLDYDGLFLVPGPQLIFPYESCYTHPNSDGTYGRLWQEPAQHMHQILEDWGIKFADGWDLIPDHIGVELYFMASLCRFAAENKLDLHQLEEWQREFFQTHLHPWVFKLIDNLEQKAATGFYRGIAKLLRNFLLEEWQALNLSA